MSIAGTRGALLALGLSSALGGCGIADLVKDLSDREIPNAEDYMPLPEDYPGQGGAPKQADGVGSASQLIDAQGGQLAIEAGAIDVPAGALADGVEIEISEVDEGRIHARLPSVLHAVAPAVAFTPHGQTFQAPVTLSLFHRGSGSALVVLRLDDESDSHWERVPATFVEGVAYVTSTHFSIYNVSECDPGDDPDGFCAGLVTGELEIEDVPEEEFSDFDAPDDLGGGAGGGDGMHEGDAGAGGFEDPSDEHDGDCSEACDTVRVCDGEAEQSPSKAGDEGAPDEDCVLVEQCRRVCTGDDSGSGMGGLECTPPTSFTPLGCKWVAGPDCTFDLRCGPSTDGGDGPTPPTDSMPGVDECQKAPEGCGYEFADNLCGYEVVCN